jgi:GSH-dependent disulfide-bond oxidoreductase
VSLTLYTWPTPNTRKVTIALAELGWTYTTVAVDLGRGDQFEPAFLALNPNNRVPVLVDDDGERVVVFESGAILLHLAEKSGRLLPEGAAERALARSWLFWQVGGLGPALGQTGHFTNYVETPYAAKRAAAEVDRLFGAMERGLRGRDYLAGSYSIADIACFPWVWSAPRITPLDFAPFPHVAAWRDRVAARPAVREGMNADRALRRAWSDADRATLFGQTAASVAALEAARRR